MKIIVNGYNIEFDPSKPIKTNDGETIPTFEGIVVSYDGWDKDLEIPDEIEVEKAFEVTAKDKFTEVKLENKSKVIVTSIDISAFENYIYAEKVKIPETVKTIGKFAFKKCLSLKYVYVPGSVKEIPDYCFINCKALEKIDFNEGLKKIGDYSFSGCEKLSSVSIPSGCYHIGFSCFEKCRILRTVEFPKDFNINKVDYFAFKYSGFEKKFADMLDNKK